MACSPTKGRLLPCKDAVGGIKGLYFIDYGTPVVTYDVTQTNVIDDLGAVTAYEYDIKSASNLIQTMTSSNDNGTTFVNQVITAILQKLTWSDNAEILLLGYGHPHVVIHMKDGTSVAVGIEFGASLETGISDSGTQMGDTVAYTLTISADERKYANYLKGSTVTDAFAGLTTAPTVVVGTEIAPA